MVAGGGMCGWGEGASCMAAGGHAWLVGECVWLQGVVHGCGGCMVVGGHAWLLGECIGYDEIWSMSGWYASYWNAFLFHIKCPVKYVDLTQ